KQDGSFSTLDYSLGNCVISTDESGRQHKSCSDGLGRLIEVREPNPAAAASSGSGMIIISGSEQQSQVGLPSSGTATINGTEGSITTTVDPCADQGGSCPHTVTYNDSGTVS